jgi:four helix bundle protein
MPPKTDLDFISKLEGAQQELDESDLWLELLGESNVIETARLTEIRQDYTDDSALRLPPSSFNLDRR